MIKPDTPPARLLVQEEIEVVDNAVQPVKQVVTRHDIEYDLSALLKSGLTTSSAGGFLLIPYLLQLNAHKLIGSLGPPKQDGIPNERLALGMIFESIFGLTVGIRAVDSISRADFGLLAGLPFLPGPSTQYRFLHDVPFNDALNFQVELGKRLVELGQVKPSLAVNVDGHNIKTYTRKAMKRSFISREKGYGKAIRTFYSQDQASRKPLIALASYSGTGVSQITEQLASLTRDVLGHPFLMVADKEWYCGRLIQELHHQFGISVLTPMRQTKKRLKEFEAVPLDQYEKTAFGNIAAIYTTMKDFNGPLRMLLKKSAGGKYFALITPKRDMSGETAMPTYTKRWRIENFFKENSFLGVDHLPSLNLNAIQTALSLRLLAFHVIDNFRNDLGAQYKKHTPQLVHRNFIDGVQGKIQLRGDLIEVVIYGFKHQDVVAPKFSNLNSKLEAAGIDPRIPWLGDRRLCFKFS